MLKSSRSYKLEFKNPITFKDGESFDVELEIVGEEVTLSATAECRSCLNTVGAEELRGRLCIQCIKKAGKFLRDDTKEYVDSLVKVDISNRVCI